MKAGIATYKAGTSVITEGEAGQEMFVVESGSVEVFRGSGPKEHRLSLLEAGDFFGEMALLFKQPKGSAFPVAIALGGPPASLFSAMLPLPGDLDEITFAGFLRGAAIQMATRLRCCG